MRLAFYTYSYTDRLKMPIGECLERVAKWGYASIDVSGTNGSSADPKSFDAARRKLTRRTTERLGLRVEAIITHAVLTDTLVDPKRKTLDLRGSIDLASDVGADVVTFHLGGEHEGITRKALWAKVVETLKSAADYGAGRHVSIAVDGIWPVWLDNSSDALQEMFDDVDSEHFGVNFDPCYLTLMGVEPVGFVKRFHKQIVHAHLKDHKGKYPKWTHEIPGQGEMNYAPVFGALERVKFDGAVAVECFTNMKFEEACDSGYAAMTAAATKAGAKFAPQGKPNTN
jgi:protein FrlC